MTGTVQFVRLIAAVGATELAIFSAIASDLATAKDPNRLTAVQIESAFWRVIRTEKGPIK